SILVSVTLGSCHGLSCYQCRNFRKVLDDNAPDLLHKETDYQYGLGQSLLCQEFVHPDNLSLLLSSYNGQDGSCEESLNSCFKIVTKARAARKTQTHTIVSRGCADIHNSMREGCIKTRGSLGLEQEFCICHGQIEILNMGDRKDQLCFTCNNYASIGQDAKAHKKGIATFGGRPVHGGMSYIGSDPTAGEEFTDVQRATLCAEKVDRKQILRLITEEEPGTCRSKAYNGCFKLVTKGYRIQSHTGRNVLVATVVTRGCMQLNPGEPSKQSVTAMETIVTNQPGREASFI
ncbi:hypothetical protein Ciccas_001981, partial [Cichlidogyrus casuarinus]